MSAAAALSRFALLLALSGAGTAAIADAPSDIDARIEAVLAAQGVPGMALAIVQDGKVVLARGYGVRRLGAPEAVDADTIFPLGSVSKAFTSAALAVLVDDGKIGWDDRVIDHLPGFRMYDPWVTREITVIDLLVHRSGLGLGAGDLLFVPRTSRSRADIVHALRHIKPATSFRSGYAYDNVLYVVAGQLVEAVSGQSWEAFVRERLLAPAGMATATTDAEARFASINRVQPHARLDGRIRGIGKQEPLDERATLVAGPVAPAGGVTASANDMARWLLVQLARGAVPGASEDGARVFSAAASEAMWTPQVTMPIGRYPPPVAEATPQFSAYALGWDVTDYRGTKLLEHGGAVFGAQALVVLVPGHDLGFAMQINSEDGVVLRGMMYELLDHFLDAPKRDWVADFAHYKQARVDAALVALDATQAQAKPSKPSLPLSGYVGTYVDPWYGAIGITEERERCASTSASRQAWPARSSTSSSTPSGRAGTTAASKRPT